VSQKTSEKEGSVDVVTVPPHYCAADTLLLLKPKLDSDFLILNWDILFDPNLLHSLVDMHRIKSSILTCLFYQEEKEKEDKGKGKGPAKKGGHQPPWSFDSLKAGVPFRSIPPRINHYFGLSGSRLLVATPTEGAGGKGGDEASSVRFSITKTMLRRFPDITVSRTLADTTVYMCSHQVLEFISANIDSMHRRTFQIDVLPRVVKTQFNDPIFHVAEPVTETEQLLRDMMNISGGNKDRNEKAVGNLGSPSGAKCFALVATAKSHGFIGRVSSLQTLVEMNREIAHLSSSFFRPRGEKTPQNYFVGEGVEIGNKPQLGAESVVGDGCQSVTRQ
jgi:NDP-sugar pyrophosphorylase family protein